MSFLTDSGLLWPWFFLSDSLPEWGTVPLIILVANLTSILKATVGITSHMVAEPHVTVELFIESSVADNDLITKKNSVPHFYLHNIK